MDGVVLVTNYEMFYLYLVLKSMILSPLSVVNPLSLILRTR